MKVLNIIGFILNVLILIALSVYVAIRGSEGLAPGSWEYKDLVSVILTGVTIVLAFIGVIVAAAAIWGYQSIKSVAEQKAEQISKDGCDSYLKSEEFLSRIDLVLRERMEREAREAIQNALAPVVVGSDEAPEYHDKDESEGQRQQPTRRGDARWQD